MIPQTTEDQAINRTVAKKIGTWDFSERTEPGAVIARHSIARTRTHAMVRNSVQITCTGWERLIK